MERGKDVKLIKKKKMLVKRDLLWVFRIVSGTSRKIYRMNDLLYLASLYTFTVLI